MSYCIAVISSENFEEPFVVLGASLGQVVRSIATFVREAGVHTSTNEEVVVPDDVALFDWADYAPTLLENLEDVEGLTINLYGLGDYGDKHLVGLPIEVPTSFADWCRDNRPTLRRMHVPLVKDVAVEACRL